MTFQNAQLIWKVVNILHINSQDWMVIISYTLASVVLVILHYYVLRNNLIATLTQYNVEFLDKEGSY